MTTILHEIARSRQKRVDEARLIVSEADLKRLAAAQKPALDVIERLRRWPFDQKRAVIAEIKRKSPSKGPIAPDLDAAKTARAYEEAGAFAISCLTEPDYFGGGLKDFKAARAAAKIPLLYKDFIADPYQIYEARAHGADMALIIVALLGEETKKYHGLMAEAGLTPLVEVHDEPELEIALQSGAKLIGVNSRNLKTFKVDIEEGMRLVSLIPKDIFAVAESGIRGTAEMERFIEAGARAFLIGETVVSAPDPKAALAALVKRG